MSNLTAMSRRIKQNCDPARLTAFWVLSEFDKLPSSIPVLLDSHFHQCNLSPLDRSFVSHLVYGVIRFREQLDFMISRHVTQKNFQKERSKSTILRLGAFQLMPDSRVPVSAAINETVKLTLATLGSGLTGFVNAVLRKISEESADWDRLLPNGNSIRELSVKYSQPKWLVRLLVEDHGLKTAVSFLSAFQKRLDTTVRINRFRTSRNRFEKELLNIGSNIVQSGFSNYHYLLKEDINISEFKPLKMGKCFVQNVSSSIVTALLSPSTTDRVLDICAAPGGKTASIAMMTGKPENITAVDIDPQRTEMMRKNLKNLNIQHITTETGDGRSYTGGQFDKILVDAPCSGFGALAKHPEIKYTQSLENTEKLVTIQLNILNNAAKLLKPESVLVYSVCTLTNSETIHVKNEFLDSNRNFSLDVPNGFRYHQFVRDDNTLLIPPGEGNLEGMFAFRVRKSG